MRRQFMRRNVPTNEQKQIDMFRELYGIKQRKDMEEENWNGMLSRMASYIKSHHTYIISTKDETYRDLYNWGSHQKRLYREKRRLPERERKLIEIGYLCHGVNKSLKKES